MYKSLSEKRGQEIDELNKVMSRRAEEQKILEARLKQYEDSNDGGEYIWSTFLLDTSEIQPTCAAAVCYSKQELS